MVFPFVKNGNFNCRQVGILNVANHLIGNKMPEAVVQPVSTEEVVELVRWANKMCMK